MSLLQTGDYFPPFTVWLRFWFRLRSPLQEEGPHPRGTHHHEACGVTHALLFQLIFGCSGQRRAENLPTGFDPSYVLLDKDISFRDAAGWQPGQKLSVLKSISDLCKEI